MIEKRGVIDLANTPKLEESKNPSEKRASIPLLDNDITKRLSEKVKELSNDGRSAGS